MTRVDFETYRSGRNTTYMIAPPFTNIATQCEYYNAMNAITPIQMIRRGEARVQIQWDTSQIRDKHDIAYVPAIVNEP